MTSLRRAIAGLALFLVFAPPVDSRPLAESVRLAPATPGAVRFTVSIPAPTTTVLDHSDGLTRLELADHHLEAPEPGGPALPLRIVTVAIPPLGEVRLRAVASELESIDRLLLAPLLAPARDPNDPMVLRRDLAAYGAEGSLQPIGARLIGTGWMRNQRVARIAIEPAAYSPSSRRLTLARRVDIDLQVQPMADLGPPAEPRDAFESIYRTTLVNYQQGVSWRRPATAVLAHAARQMGIEPSAANGFVNPPDTSVFVGRTWVRFALDRAGFYAVNYSRLRTTALFSNDSCAIDSLRLFTLPGFPVLPEANYCDTCDYREVAIGAIDARGDGRFSDNNDTFYFFAQGASGWADEFDPSRPDTSFINHPYEARNFYYLTIATSEAPVGGVPRRITTRSVTPLGAGTPVSTVSDRVHLEQDLEFWPDVSATVSTLFWEKWFWRSMSQGGFFNVDFPLPHADLSQPARIRLRQWGLTDNFITLGCPSNMSPSDHLLDVTVNGMAFNRKGWRGSTDRRGGALTIDTTGFFLTTSQPNRIALAVPVVTPPPQCPQRIDRSALAWVDVFYERRLVPEADRLAFRTPASAGTFRYNTGPFITPTPPRAFDVSDPLRPVELVGGSYASSILAFEDTQTSRKRYELMPDSVLTRGILPASQISDAAFTSLDNLRSPQRSADYVLIYYDGFKTAADSLVEWRRSSLPLTDGRTSFEAVAIPVSAIHDQFSGGRIDPGAIRNFLRSAFFNWTGRPTFVTFLGDGSYDYKDITGRAPAGQPGTLVTTYDNLFDNSFIVQRMYASDDWMLNINNAGLLIPDFLGGRLPANDASTALAVVRDKILRYERTAPFGEYRNRFMLIADDDLQGDRCDGLGWTHLFQTAFLDTASIEPHVDRAYVYLHTYPSGPGGTRPGARAAIKDNINAGVSVFNYVGHGSPFKISDESVFIDSDAGTLTNGARMPLFVAASCDVGKFNDPTVQSLGERLVMTGTGGAVAVISATELAFSGDNAILNLYLYEQFFRRDDLLVRGDTLDGTGQYHVPISAALLAAKERAGSSVTNNSKYQLMGDAATRLNLPRLWTELSLEDSNGDPVTSMQRGQTVTFRGRVLDQPGGSQVPYTGVASLLIEDSRPIEVTSNQSGCGFGATPFFYTAGPMFKGDVSTVGGLFEGRFVVPLDAVAGDAGRVRAYIQGRETDARFDVDGVGTLRAPVVPGTAPSSDIEGPRINLSFVGGAVSVRPDATLQIDLFDESGIMTTGHSLQNSIVVTVDDNTTNRTDVTSTFRYAADSYQSGTATFQLPNLAAGPHRIRVSAADNLATGITASQHRSSTSIDFEVVDVPPLNVARAYLFPTPASSKGPGSGGAFIVDAPGDSVNTLIRVYTVSGRLVRTLRQFGGLGQVQIPWDGRDAEGEPLANGPYLFKVHVSVRDADGTSSPRQRAIAEGRFVILNH